MSTNRNVILTYAEELSLRVSHDPHSTGADRRAMAQDIGELILQANEVDDTRFDILITPDQDNGDILIKITQKEWEP